MQLIGFSRLFQNFVNKSHFTKIHRSLVTYNSTSLGNGENTSIISYKLPEKIKGFDGIVGDKHVKKSPILDFKKSNFAIFGSLNSNIVYQPPIFEKNDSKIFSIMNNIINENNLSKNYDLPTHTNFEISKKADYYKHKDPNRFSHLLWVRHRKMKKHQRIKWQKKNLAMIKRRKLERNISKEKLFRAELLAQVREAENFDPEEYVKNILHTIDNVPKTETPQQKLERYKDLIRKNRTETNLIMPKFDSE